MLHADGCVRSDADVPICIREGWSLFGDRLGTSNDVPIFASPGFTSETAGAAGTAHPVRFEAAPLLCASNGIRVRDGNPAWSTFIKADIAPAVPPPPPHGTVRLVGSALLTVTCYIEHIELGSRSLVALRYFFFAACGHRPLKMARSRSGASRCRKELGLSTW